MNESQDKVTEIYIDQIHQSDHREGELSLKLVLVLGMLSAIAALSTDMYLPLFPAISHVLNATPAGVQLSLTSFMAGLAVGQLIIGPWSDVIGRRNLLLGGMVLLTVASIACALSTSIQGLIVGRFFQGAGGAAGIVLTRAIVSDLSFGNKAAYYFNLILAIQGVAPIVAPLMGGVAAFFPWPVVFIFMAITSFTLTILAFVYVPESLPEKRGFYCLYINVFKVKMEKLKNYTITKMC